MPSPVTSDSLPALTSTASICDRFSQLINVYDQFSEFLSWLLGDDGELSDEALDGIADRTTPVGTILLYASASPPSSKFLMSFFIPGDASITGSATAITSGELATTIQIDGASGTVTPHENRPPYCAVQFIIKVL